MGKRGSRYRPNLWSGEWQPAGECPACGSLMLQKGKYIVCGGPECHLTLAEAQAAKEARTPMT